MLTNRQKQAGAGYGFLIFLWLAFIGWGFMVNQVFGYIWLVIALIISAAVWIGAQHK